MAYREPTTHFTEFIQFTKTDNIFLNSIKPWSKKKWSTSFGSSNQNKKRNKIINKIKKQLEVIQDNYCAFCGLDLEFTNAVHREHIAPQYKHPYYIFEPENLVLACDYCNMRKGKKRTVETDTRIYSTTTFKILHPYRDDFSSHLKCDIQKRELVFVILGPEFAKTENTVKCVGLNDPDLVSRRGNIIFSNLWPKSKEEDKIIMQINSKNRRGSR